VINSVLTRKMIQDKTQKMYNDLSDITFSVAKFYV